MSAKKRFHAAKEVAAFGNLLLTPLLRAPLTAASPVLSDGRTLRQIGEALVELAERLHGAHLTLDDVKLLSECPYESPRFLTDTAQHRARPLIKMGLLELAPTSKRIRCTGAGMEVVLDYRQRGWLQ